MRAKVRSLHRLAVAAVLAIASAGVLPILTATPASAQFPWFEGQQRRYAPAPRQQPTFNPFGLFAPSPPSYDRPGYRAPQGRPHRRSQEQRERVPVDSSRAPPAHRPDGTPTTQIVVLGDALADWLAYGIEEAYSDDSDIGVVRKNRMNSGLVRNEGREGYDWVQQAKDILAADKADFVVVMLGLSDRQSIRERPAPKPANPAGSQQPPPLVAEPPAAAPTTHEFRSEKWAELYGKRIDEMIAALKSKGVPVLWVGLPVIRGARGKADVLYLNDLYRSHAEKAGITYVDVWDGFVDDNGDFALYGPDYDGQTRRLRAHDGVYFTKAGALKLGHYVEHELQRLMQARNSPVAVTAPEPTRPGGPVARPDIGPVVPLTATLGETDGLVGGGPARAPTPDPTAARVLVKGETPAALPGRADDFTWPRADAAANVNDVIPLVQPAAVPVRAAAPPVVKKTPAPKRPGQAAANPPPQKQVR